MQVLGLEEQLQRQRSRASLLRERLKAQQPPDEVRVVLEDQPSAKAPLLTSVSPGDAPVCLPARHLWIARHPAAGPGLSDRPSLCASHGSGEASGSLMSIAQLPGAAG